MSDIAETRRRLRELRRELSRREQSQHSLAAARHLRSFARYLNARSIALYSTEDGELDLTSMADLAWRSGKRVYLPLLHPFAGNRLWFGEWKKADQLLPNRFGIPEPDPRWCKPRKASSIDLVIMPLVAFDERLGRIGMGGGFYDRTFAFRRRIKGWRRPFLLGAAHELQRIGACPARDWDITMDAVLTEKGIYLRAGKKL